VKFVGLTYVKGRVRSLAGRGRSRTVRFLVDSGAVYSLLPPRDWKALGIRPKRTVEFVLADGSPLHRKVGECRLRTQPLR